MVKLGDREFPEEMLINDVLTMRNGRDVPANWTHQDLADHLSAKGIPVTIQHDPGLASANGQGVWFVDARPPANPNETRVKRGRTFATCFPVGTDHPAPRAGPGRTTARTSSMRSSTWLEPGLRGGACRMTSRRGSWCRTTFTRGGTRGSGSTSTIPSDETCVNCWTGRRRPTPG